MTERRVAVIARGLDVAWRFDKSAEIVLLEFDRTGELVRRAEIVLPRSGAEALCEHLVQERVETVVVGAVEDEYYHYLRWKRIEVIDNVAGTVDQVVERLMAGDLVAGAILFEKPEWAYV